MADVARPGPRQGRLQQPHEVEGRACNRRVEDVFTASRTLSLAMEGEGAAALEALTRLARRALERMP